MRIAVTGASGRLGGALLRTIAASAAASSPANPALEILPWGRAELDLDAPESVGEHLDSAAPDLVIHAAAWTDVDGCARDPELAGRRNGDATGVLATAAARRGIDLIVISTNEVFDASSADPQPYRPSDPPMPSNPYGASKLAGERFAADAYASAPPRRSRGGLGIVRTAWLFGPGRPDFPVKIALAAQRAIASGEPLRLVADEIGTPTFVDDVAEAILDLILDRSFSGIHHVVSGGIATRAEWGRDILRRLELPVDVLEISLADFRRPSRPPRWGVLAPTPLPRGRVLRHWHEAMATYIPALRESVTMTT